MSKDDVVLEMEEKCESLYDEDVIIVVIKIIMDMLFISTYVAMIATMCLPFYYLTKDIKCDNICYLGMSIDISFFVVFGIMGLIAIRFYQ